MVLGVVEAGKGELFDMLAIVSTKQILFPQNQVL
jgi:hypothetical protein